MRLFFGTDKKMRTAVLYQVIVEIVQQMLQEEGKNR